MVISIDDSLDFIPPLRSLKVRKVKPVVTSKYNLKQLYYDARRVMFEQTYPEAHSRGEYYNSTFPKIHTSNGLTMAIINFLNWSGHNADRTGTQGRMIKVNGQYKRISSANRKGTSDISATLHGRSVKLEIKIGNDTPSKEQLREQDKERAAGGVYEFIHSFDEFFDWYFEYLKTIV